MKIFLIFDGRFDSDILRDILKTYGDSEVIVFSLVSDYLFLDTLIPKIQNGGKISVKVHNSAQAVSDQVIKLREKICKWSADIGDSRVLSKSVKDWMILPGCGVSTWWFSLLSEKNTLKTDAYFRIAQIHAIEELIAGENSGVCLLSITNKGLYKSINGIARKYHLSIKVIPVCPPQAVNNFKSRILGLLDRLGLLGSILNGLLTWGRFVLRARTARKGLSDFAKRKASSGKFLFVSYFPNLDKEAARDGVFRNKYALALQDKLKESDIPVTWLLMPVPIDGYDFKDAVKLANDFSRKGTNLFILEEFLTWGIAIKALFLWIRQIVLSSFLFSRIKKTSPAAQPVGWQGYPVVQSLWEGSFDGSFGMQGILYALIFREVFKQISDVEDCLYYCEMHAWEKALNAAKKDIKPLIRTIGHQHASASKNDLGYFYDRSETLRTGKTTDLPLPDILACNGKYFYDLLSESGYPNLIETEAVRYLYLDKVLSMKSISHHGRQVLLVAGPYNRNEAKALVALVSTAFPIKDQFDIWFKGHPSMPLEEIFEELGVDYQKAGFMIKHGNISEYLNDVRAVVVPTSTVAMEALAAGCEVIVPVFSDAMIMNPLADFDNYYHNVTTPQELKLVMEKIICGALRCSSEGYRQFLRKYWNLDPLLPLWSRLLEGMKHA